MHAGELTPMQSRAAAVVSEIQDAICGGLEAIEAEQALRGNL